MWQFGKLIHFYALAIRIVIVRRQLQCFDALLIFKRMLMSENVRILQFKHQICGTFCVHRYQQFCTLMVNGNAYNQNLLIDVKRLIWSGQHLVLFNCTCRKSTTGFSLGCPFGNSFLTSSQKHRMALAADTIACHNRIEFYLFKSNFIRWFLPRERSGSTGPGETTVGC